MNQYDNHSHIESLTPSRAQCIIQKRYRDHRRKKYFFSQLFFICFFSILLPTKLSAGDLRLAVASNFLDTAKILANQFSRDTGHVVTVSSGSSGKLFLQIKNGAPFDIFLSADAQKPNQLIVQNLALESSLRTYALGSIAFWQKNCTNISTIENIDLSSINKMAIANPALAPYGLASQQAMEKLNLWHKLQPKLVFPENISQVAQMAKIGVVDAAIIAQSNRADLDGNANSCSFLIDRNNYSSIEQKLVITAKSNQKALAIEFINYIGSQNALDLIKNKGYYVSKPVKIDSSDKESINWKQL